MSAIIGDPLHGAGVVVAAREDLIALAEWAFERGRIAGRAEAPVPVSLPLVEAARRVGRSEDYVRALCDAGDVESVRDGKYRLVLMASLETHERKRMTQGKGKGR